MRRRMRSLLAPEVAVAMEATAVEGMGGGGNRNGATPANNNPTPRGDRPRIPAEKLKRLIAEGRCFNCRGMRFAREAPDSPEPVD
jgi:hypothetical protein